MQSDLGRQVNILEGGGILSVNVIKEVHMITCLILNGCLDRAVGIHKHKSIMNANT